jgi:isopenicillin N synthase-like dioxygenase
MDLPVIDLTPLGAGDFDRVAAQVDDACRSHGFFSITGHGVPADLIAAVEESARSFIALPRKEKSAIAMELAGQSWRGWFPPGGELTSGIADRKEGIYFGREEDPTSLPLRGPNLFPLHPPGLRAAVLEYLDRLEALGRLLVETIERGLRCRPGMLTSLIERPTILFRIFAYPPAGELPSAEWGVAEHTDYGLLTVLHQDSTGGLEVRTGSEWIPVEPVEDAFVCNIGDMLERATGGAYVSTPHRVRSPVDRLRISMPFFFDPSWDARVRPIDGLSVGSDRAAVVRQRWDGADPLLFDGTYGEYLWGKVGRVFPDLRA